MRIVQITDVHLKNEEPFFRAGVALNSYIFGQLEKETEPFAFLDGGDRFHVSKETGRVNGEVTKFFLEMASISNCENIMVMQGNHDVKEETGSALDVIKTLNFKITMIDDPYLIATKKNSIVRYQFNDADDYIYLLPHMRPYSKEGYTGIKSYGDENFHKEYWKKQGYNWNTIKDKIKLISMHGGDETTGKLFMNADISFLPGPRSNGHVHKQISKNHLPSAMITRRDEIDKKCFIRKIDIDSWTIRDIEIPLFLNYAQIQYGEDVESYFKSGVHILPKESLIVDIYGHDDKDLVVKEYMEKWLGTRPTTARPIYYVGEVTPVERRGETILTEERDELDIGSVNIKELFMEFCKEKKIADNIQNDLISRIE